MSAERFHAVLYCVAAGDGPGQTRWQLRTESGVVLASFTGTYAQASGWARRTWRERSTGQWPLYGTDDPGSDEHP